MKATFQKMLKGLKEPTRELSKFAISNDIDISTSEGLAEAREQFDASVAFISDVLESKIAPPFPANVKDAAYSDDLSILFRKAVEQRLGTYRATDTFLYNTAATVMEFDAGEKIIEFLHLGPVSLHRMGPMDNYQVENPAVTSDNVELRIEKYGLLSEYPVDMFKETSWPLLGITTDRMVDAVGRSRENQLYQIMLDSAQVVLDNTGTDSAYYTQGVDKTDALNFTFSMKDLTKVMGYVIAQRYKGTHFLSHPLMWGVFANDPYLRSTFFHGGQVGGAVHSTAPTFDQSVNMPGGWLNYVPYYQIGYSDIAALADNPDGSGLDDCIVADAFVIDAANAMYHAKAGEAELANHEEFGNDAFQMKVRASFASAPKDGGKGMARVKGIRNDYNYEAIYTVRQV